MHRNSHSIGLAILALITALAGLLGVLMAGAIILMGSAGAAAAQALTPGWLLVLGLSYLVLAWTLYLGHALAPELAVILLVALVVAATLGLGGAERMDLGVTLVLALAGVTNIAVVMALFLPGNRERFRESG